MKVKEHGILMQIGINNGKDEFNEIVKSTHPARVILVEPNASLNYDLSHEEEDIWNMVARKQNKL